MKTQYSSALKPAVPGRARRQRTWMSLVFILAYMSFPAPVFSADTQSQEDAALWEALRSGGHVALMRHAIAPGTGDPSNFTLEDCATQRNLSERGRAQARRVGERFRANGIEAAQVYSSQWCRCIETAELLGLGPVQALPALNSFFRNYQRGDSQTRTMKAWLASQVPGQPLVLVTHQVNITALTDVYPASGELVVLRRSEDGELSVVGTLETD